MLTMSAPCWTMPLPRYTGYTEIPAQGVTGELEAAGGGSTLGTVTVSDPGVKLLLADGLTAADVSVTPNCPNDTSWGLDLSVYAVYTIHVGGTCRKRPASGCLPL